MALEDAVAVQAEMSDGPEPWRVSSALFLICAVLAFFLWRFVAFATDQRASTTPPLIAEALSAIGGVPLGA